VAHPAHTDHGSVTWTGDATLSGDTLTVSAFGTAAISTSGAETLDLVLAAPAATATVDVAARSTLTLTAQQTSGYLNTSGGTIKFVGNSFFNGYSTVLDDTLTGNGTLDLYGQNANGESMEVNGFVGAGLTFSLAGTAPDATLQIARPHEFFGKIDLTQAPVGVGHVAFDGITATSASLFDGILAMFDGHKLADVVRVSGGTDLHLYQNTAGVFLTSGAYSDLPASSLGSAIPLHKIA
jgi:hypothetical protein